MAQIVTFYSYKGGTGRSMLLANIAWILAANKQRVLVVDWDLEAPGLHRYYSPFLADPTLESTEGIIDMLSEFALEAMTPVTEPRAPDWYKPLADITDYAVALEYPFEAPGSLHLVPAGRQSATYATLVNSFDWQRFYDHLGGGVFLDEVRSSMAGYDWVLIDSRTGVSDTAGICTVQMPDMLVVCFTYNNQSIDGASAVAESVIKQRKPPFRVFPIPTRVEGGEQTKLERARDLAHDRFAKTLGSLAEKPAEYWAKVEVPYTQFYAYEEILATFGDKWATARSVLQSCQWLVKRLSNGEITGLPLMSEPERQRWLAEMERKPLQGVQGAFKYDVFLSYSSTAEVAVARDVARYLRKCSLKVFFDDEASQGATRTQRTKEEELASSRHMVVVVGSRGGGRFQLNEISAFIRWSLDQQGASRKIVPLLMPGTSVEVLPSVLQQVVAIQVSIATLPDVLRQVYDTLTSQSELRQLDATRGSQSDQQSAAAPDMNSDDLPSSYRTRSPLDRPRTPTNTLRVVSSTVAITAAVALLVGLLWRSCSPDRDSPMPDAQRGSGSGTAIGVINHQQNDLQKRDFLLDRARHVSGDPLTVALILREIPESVFPTHEVQGFLDGELIPEAVFDDLYFVDAQLSSQGDQVLLETRSDVMLANVDRSKLETIPAPGVSLAFFLRDAQGVAIADQDGLRLRRTPTGALEKIKIAGDPKHFVVGATDAAGEQLVVASDATGVNGTQDSIYIVRKDQAVGNRLLDSKQPIRAIGFIGDNVAYVRGDGVVAVFKATNNADIQAEPKPPLAPSGLFAMIDDDAAVIASGQQWAAWFPGRFRGRPILNLKFPAAVTAISITSDFVAAASNEGLAVLNADDQLKLDMKVSGSTSLAITGEKVVIGTTNGASVVPIGASAAATRLDPGGDSVVRIHTSAGSPRVVAVYASGTVRIWNLAHPLALKGLSAAAMRQELEAATSACLTAKQRTAWQLAATPEHAVADERACRAPTSTSK